MNISISRHVRPRNLLKHSTTLAAIIAVGLLVVTAQAPSQPDTTMVANGQRFDPELVVQWHGMWAYYTDDQRETVLTHMQNANIHAIQMDVSWAMLQPHDGQSYDPWGVAFVDRVIDMINAHGMTAIITLWLTPGWANGHIGQRALPTDPTDYARVAQWAANRYAGKVSAWEVWTEPNKEWSLAGAANPFDYVRLLRLAYPAIKAGDPNATVVFGALLYNDDPWLALAYDAGAKDHFDVMATHSFQGLANESPGSPDDGSIWKFTHLTAVRSLMVDKGDGAKSIWTSMGYSTHRDPPNTPNWYRGVEEGTQATYLAEAVNIIRDNWPWAGKFIWSMARDEFVSANFFHQRHYGLLRADLTPKPALATLKDLATPAAP